MPNSVSTPTSPGDAKYEPKHTVKGLNDHAREFFLRIADDSELYRSYLGTIAKFPSYSAMNAVRIHEAAPDATQVRDVETWNKFGCTVKGKESGIPITQPEYNPKTHKTFFKVKYLFTEGQVTGDTKVKDKHDMGILEQAFEKVEVPAPTTPEGKYIVGTYFGIGGYLKDGTLPPADLLAVEKVEEACANIKDYVDDIRKSANAFIRAVEGAYKGIAVENMHEKNSGLFQALRRSGATTTVTQSLSQVAEIDTNDVTKSGTWKPRGNSAENEGDIDAKLDAAQAAAESERVAQVKSTERATNKDEQAK